MNQEIDILDEGFKSRSEARPAVNQAIQHFKQAKRATIQAMADLRRLQDGGVHFLYGERSFNRWAARTFEGLTEGNVKQLTRAGGVALELEKHGRLDLAKPEGIGTTALRDLSVIGNEYGTDKMIEVFDTAKGMLEEGKEISNTTIKAAMQLLMPPAATPLEVPPSIQDDDEVDEEELEPDEIRERISHIQDMLYDVSESAMGQAAYTEVMEEMGRLGRLLRGEAHPEDQQWLESSR